MGLARERFMGAAALALGSAFFIRHPMAFSIAAALGVVTADPDSMRDAMDKWKTEQAGGTTKELEELRNSVNSLAERLKKDAHWEAGTFDILKPLMDDFIVQTDNAAKQRDGVGDALNSSAKLYDTLSWVAVAVAGAMAIIAACVSATRTNPVSAPVGEASAAAGLKGLWTTVKPVLKTLWTLAMTVGGVFMGVQMLSMNQAVKFQSMEAMPMFNGLALGNDPTSGALTPGMIEDDTTLGKTLPGQTAQA